MMKLALEKQPLVSVVTPVYNGESYLAECIESVIAQSYDNWEFIIVNNCSTDNSLKIAERFASNKKRIIIYNNESFLNISGNWNHAVRQISKNSKYCKVVLADDWIFPDCLMQMVDLMESNPTVGVTGSYVLQGDTVTCAGLPFPSTVVSGRELCRKTLMGKVPYIFGSPSALQMRVDLVRKHHRLYNGQFHQLLDQTACYKLLGESDFGFVHQVLSYYRLHKKSQTSNNVALGKQSIEEIEFMDKYGPLYLSPDEQRARKKEKIKVYYSVLGKGVLKLKKHEFWKFNREKMKSLKMPLNPLMLVTAIITVIYRNVLLILINPKQKIKSLFS